MRRQLGCEIARCTRELGRREPFGSDEVRAPQIRIRQIGLVQIRAVKIGPMEISLVQDSTTEIGVVEIGVMKIGPTKFRAMKIGPVQVGLVKIGAVQVRVLEVGSVKIGIRQNNPVEIGAMQVDPMQIRLLPHFPSRAHPGLVTLNDRLEPCRRYCAATTGSWLKAGLRHIPKTSLSIIVLHIVQHPEARVVFISM
jgi:hypothetical protein